MGGGGASSRVIPPYAGSLLGKLDTAGRHELEPVPGCCREGRAGTGIAQEWGDAQCDARLRAPLACDQKYATPSPPSTHMNPLERSRPLNGAVDAGPEWCGARLMGAATSEMKGRRSTRLASLEASNGRRRE